MHRPAGLAIACCLAVALAACPGGNQGPTTPGGGTRGSGGGTRGSGSGGGSGSATDDVLPDPAVAAAGVPCVDPGCVYHGGLVAGAYFSCFSSGNGACFHFGAPCAPADACMYDAASQAYRHCDAVVQGACATFAAACTPKSACAYNPADNLHHTCESWSSGKCGRWGALCAP